MPLKRTKHWATRELHHYLQSNKDTPFAWGTFDCCLFPASAIEAMTGIDLAAAFRGQYHDQASALALIKKITGGTTVSDAAAWCASQHHLPELQHPLMAQRGDLVIVNNPGATGVAGQIAGLVHLTGRHVVSVGESGLIKLCITNVVRAWRV